MDVIDDVKNQILLRLPIDQLISFYRPNKELFDSLWFLRSLQERHCLPIYSKRHHHGIVSTSFVVETFVDFVIAYDRRDPERRKNLLMSSKKQLELAIDEENLDLLDNLLKDQEVLVHACNDEVLNRLGEKGLRSMIDLFIKVIPPPTIIHICCGLIAGHHNTIFREYRQPAEIPNDCPLAILSAAARSGNDEIFAEYYDRTDSGITYEVLRVAVEHGHQRIVDHIMKGLEDPLDPEIPIMIFLGHLASGNVAEMTKIFDTLDRSHLEESYQSDICITLIETDHTESYQFMKDHKFDLNLQRCNSRIHRLTMNLRVMIQDHDEVGLLRVDVFSRLLFTEDFYGLVELVTTYNPKFIFLGFALSIPNVNKCFRQWLINQGVKPPQKVDLSEDLLELTETTWTNILYSLAFTSRVKEFGIIMNRYNPSKIGATLFHWFISSSNPNPEIYQFLTH